MHSSVQHIYDQIRAQHMKGKYGTIEEGLPAGSQDSDQQDKGMRASPTQMSRAAVNPKEAMAKAGQDVAAAVANVATAANMANDKAQGKAPAPLSNAQPRQAQPTPQDKMRAQKTIQKVGQELDPDEDGTPNLNENQTTAAKQVAEKMITNDDFTANMALHLTEHQDPDRVTMLFLESIERARIETPETALKAILEHFDDDAKPVVEFVMDIISGDLSAIVEGDTPETISEGLAKKLAGLGLAAALGTGAYQGMKGVHDSLEGGMLDRKAQTQHIMNLDDETSAVNTNRAQIVKLASALAPLSKRESLGGDGQDRTAAQAYLRQLTSRVNMGRMTPDAAVRMVNRRYDAEDLQDDLQSYFESIEEAEMPYKEDGEFENPDGNTPQNDGIEDEHKKAEKRRREKLGKNAVDAPAGHTDDLDKTTKTSDDVQKSVFTNEAREELLDGIFG